MVIALRVRIGQRQLPVRIYRHGRPFGHGAWQMPGMTIARRTRTDQCRSMTITVIGKAYITKGRNLMERP